MRGDGRTPFELVDALERYAAVAVVGGFLKEGFSVGRYWLKPACLA
jgi:hypothetical protein